MKKQWWMLCLLVVSGCQGVPYRDLGFAADDTCKALYEKFDDLGKENLEITARERDSTCWRRAHEEREKYDLLTAEFDDQGWIQGTKRNDAASTAGSSRHNHLDLLLSQLRRIREKNKSAGLTVVVFVHGWHHNAKADDENVNSFRQLLSEVEHAENVLATLGNKGADKPGRHVVGIYVGWRGESLPVEYINDVTFWDRKATADRVALGSVRELFERLDHLRDEACTDGKAAPFRLLTIGHSFGGLITYNALSGALMRMAVRADGRDGVDRLGDLVVIANPAFEGTRYEPLHVAARLPESYDRRQLPVVIIATSRDDMATGAAFPAARLFSTALETQSWDQWVAGLKTVGHNDRYITHTLSLCDKDDEQCRNTCPAATVTDRAYRKGKGGFTQRLNAEFALAQRMADEGVSARQNLCGPLKLVSLENWKPTHNPFWVVSTSGDIMKGHNDIFNNYFVSFIRQVYMAVVGQARAKQATEGDSWRCAGRQPVAGLQR